MHSGMINKTKYNYPRKPIKQTTFTLKNLERNPPKNQSTIEKRNVRSSKKNLSLDSLI